jgi:transposase
MLFLPANAKVFICTHPVNMKQSFEGLGILIQQLFEEPSTSGSFFVFFNKQKDRMKVLFWDGDGFVIWYKHLQKGSFRSAVLSNQIIDRREFLMVLEGIDPKRLQKRFKI